MHFIISERVIFNKINKKKKNIQMMINIEIFENFLSLRAKKSEID